DRLQPEIETGGEVGHGQTRGKRGRLETADGGFGQVGARCSFGGSSRFARSGSSDLSVRHQLSSEMMVIGLGRVTSPVLLVTAVPSARNSMVCEPHWCDFSSRRTPTIPLALRTPASSCIRVMASSLAS